MSQTSTILEVNKIHTSFFTPVGEVKAVSDVSFSLKKGEILGVVGESGSGKSVTMLSIMRLLGTAGRIKSGNVIFDGQDLTKLSTKEISNIRGNRISMIFQDPMTSLNPVLSVAYQLKEPLSRHRLARGRDIRAKAVDMLHKVGIEPAEQRIDQYPHQFSGGQRQRIMIAMALSCNPDLLIADEPTTALDVTVQAQILELMKDIQKQSGTSIILITHDLGVIAGIADRVIVMYGSHIVEEGNRYDIFYKPSHPYTRGLLRSVPNPGQFGKERLIPIDGQPPDLLSPPPGCPYSARCPDTMKICMNYPPSMFQLEDGHKAACWLLKRDTSGGASL